MPTGDNASQKFPFLRKFSSKDRQLADKALDLQRERRRKRRESREQKAAQVAERARRRAHDLLGVREYGELRAALERERLAFRDRLLPPQGLERDFTKEKRASRRRADALARKLGANPKKFAEIRREFLEGAQEILTPVDDKTFPGFHLSKNLDKWQRLSPFHSIPLPWGDLPDLELDPNDPHRWFLFRPPFFGFLFHFDHQATDGVHVDRELFLDPPAGLVGNLTTIDASDTSYDFGCASAEAQIAFGFEPPIAGVIEVLIDAQSTIGVHDVRLEDEFGFSSTRCRQHNYLTMNVLHPNVPVPSSSLMSKLDVDNDGDDDRIIRENLPRGEHFFAHLFSSGPVPAGQSVVVAVGTLNFDNAFPDDMELHSRSNFQWFINSVEVRISP